MDFPAEIMLDRIDRHVNSLTYRSSIEETYQAYKATQDLLLSVREQAQNKVGPVSLSAIGDLNQYQIQAQHQLSVANRMTEYIGDIEPIISKIVATYQALVNSTGVDWADDDSTSGTAGFALDDRLFLQDFQLVDPSEPKFLMDGRAEIAQLGTNKEIRQLFPSKRIHFFSNDWISQPDTMIAVAGRVCVEEYMQGKEDIFYLKRGINSDLIN